MFTIVRIKEFQQKFHMIVLLCRRIYHFFSDKILNKSDFLKIINPANKKWKWLFVKFFCKIELIWVYFTLVMLLIHKVFDPIVKRTPVGLISCIGARLMGHLVCNCRQFRARPYLLCQMGWNYFWSSFLVFITLCFHEIFWFLIASDRLYCSSWS